MQVWVVGKVNKKNHKQWEFQGVYDDEQKAVAVCEDGFWFVGPIEVNMPVPTETTGWPGAYYPESGK